MDNLVADLVHQLGLKLAAPPQDGWRASEYIATMRKVINTSEKLQYVQKCREENIWFRFWTQNETDGT